MKVVRPVHDWDGRVQEGQELIAQAAPLSSIREVASSLRLAVGARWFASRQGTLFLSSISRSGRDILIHGVPLMPSQSEDPIVVSSSLICDEATRQANAVLQGSRYLPLRDLHCDFHEGVLTIRGKVPTFYLKQLAQTVVRSVVHVEEINNHVEVVWPPARQTDSSSRRASAGISTLRRLLPGPARKRMSAG